VVPRVVGSSPIFHPCIESSSLELLFCFYDISAGINY
jgi:hypothetical protein